MEITLLEEHIPNSEILTRQDICHIAKKIDPSFRETLLRNTLEKLMVDGYIIRVGRNQYEACNSKNKKSVYVNQYSKEAEEVVLLMKEKYPLLDYRVWELKWLNEFWNHQIAQNKIFIEVEHMGCDFVYMELSERYQRKVLLKPSENELYRYGEQNTIIIDRLVSEAPKGEPDNFNTPLEKIIVDLFANQKLKSMIHIGEYAMAISDMFHKYKIDQKRLLRYANRRNKKEEIQTFLIEKTDVELYVEDKRC